MAKRTQPKKTKADKVTRARKARKGVASSPSESTASETKTPTVKKKTTKAKSARTATTKAGTKSTQRKSAATSKAAKKVTSSKSGTKAKVSPAATKKGGTSKPAAGTRKKASAKKVSASGGKKTKAAGASKKTVAAKKVEPQVTAPPPLPKTRLSDADLQQFEAMLQEKRRELIGDVTNMEDEAIRAGKSGGGSPAMPIHMADIGSDTWEQELTLGLIENERGLLQEIDEALERIQDKTYGVCLATGKPITKARLRAKPWAKYCIEYARKRELGLV